MKTRKDAHIDTGRAWKCCLVGPCFGDYLYGRYVRAIRAGWGNVGVNTLAKVDYAVQSLTNG